MLARRAGTGGSVPLPLGMNRLLGRVGTGAYVDARETVLKEGSERKTDLPLDVMIRGEGFFTIQTDDGRSVHSRRSLWPRRDQHAGERRWVRGTGCRWTTRSHVTSDDIRMLPTGEILQTVAQTRDAARRHRKAVKVTETDVIGQLNAVVLKQEDLVRAGGSRFDRWPREDADGGRSWGERHGVPSGLARGHQH